ncbi:MAG: IS1 family transposase [Pirellulales bacterium]
MANVLPRDKQISVLHHLVEGNTLRSTSRLSGVARNTITALMVRFGEGCQRLLDSKLRGLTLDHVETDEIWSYVGKKQGRLTDEEKAERSDIGDVYTFTCLDQETKLIAAHVVGKRSADNARRLMMQLAGRLNFPNPHAGDDHAFGTGGFRPIIQISTDGWPGYPEAVDLAFGPYARFGTIVKDYRNAEQPGRYAPPEMIGTVRRGITGIETADEWSICTSHVERHNLTIRTLMKRFTRLGVGFSKCVENHAAAVAGFIAFYNFVWRTRYPDDSGRPGKLRPTAAMMAGVTNTLWSFTDLFDAAMAV